MAGGGGERASPRKRSGPEGGSSRPLTAKRKYVFGVGHTRLNVYLQAGYCFGGYDFFVSPISNRFRGGCLTFHKRILRPFFPLDSGLRNARIRHPAGRSIR